MSTPEPYPPRKPLSQSLLGGEEPDPRFTLANERTFLAWIRTSLAFLAGGIAVTDEYIASHYFKKLTQLDMSFGDTLHQLGEVSARMQETAGVFA